MADKIKAQLKEKTALFDQVGNQIPPLAKFAHDNGVNSGLFIAVGLAIFSFFMLIFHGVELAITTYTVIYPGMCSVRAIETKESDDDKHWLTYWMMVGTLEVIETFFGFIFWIVPYWSVLRFGLFVWMISFNGAVTIFNMIHPILKKHKGEIQQAVDMFSEGVSQGVSKAREEAMDPSNMAKAMQFGMAASQKLNEAPQEHQPEKPKDSEEVFKD